jgi:hypothetical protein
VTVKARRQVLALAAVVLSLGLAGIFMLSLPGKSHSGPLPPATDSERALALELRRDVEKLAGEIGERNVRHPRELAAAADFIERSLAAAGHAPRRQSYDVGAVRCHNLEVELTGSSEIVVVGAHYDSVVGAPGANDNGSGVAATLALARRFASQRPRRTLRFVLFANEEPPHFQTADMGSARYARRAKQRGERIVAMLSLETLGYYSDAEASQSYPPPVGMFFPSRGNFIGFVSNLSSRRLLREVVASFRSHTRFPSEGAALPSLVPGVGWSDQWAFWQEGYPALMVTDTAPFRYPHYHTPDDTPDKLDYERFARVVAGLERVVGDLAN